LFEVIAKEVMGNNSARVNSSGAAKSKTSAPGEDYQPNLGRDYNFGYAEPLRPQRRQQASFLEEHGPLPNLLVPTNQLVKRNFSNKLEKQLSNKLQTVEAPPHSSQEDVDDMTACLERQRAVKQNFLDKVEMQLYNKMDSVKRRPPSSQENVDDMTKCLERQRTQKFEKIHSNNSDKPRRLATSFYDDPKKLQDVFEHGLMTGKEIRQLLRSASRDSSTSKILRSATRDSSTGLGRNSTSKMLRSATRDSSNSNL